MYETAIDALKFFSTKQIIGRMKYGHFGIQPYSVASILDNTNMNVPGSI